MERIIRTKNKVTVILLSILALGSVACKKVLDVPLPSNLILVQNAYSDDGTAIAAVTSIYTQMTKHTNFEWGGVTANTSIYADDVQRLSSGITSNNFYIANLTSAGSDARLMMSEAYSTVLYANTSIEQLSASTTLSTQVKKQLLGECYFARAYTYFYIVNYWGSAAAMPLTSVLTASQVSPSVPSDKIYAQIIADLKLAQANLTNAYPVTDKGRPNLQAANALLARVYLYTGKYADAITQANAVVSSALYALPSPAVNFLKNSSETIWCLQGQASPTLNPTPDALLYFPTSAYVPPSNTLTPSLLASFEPGDLRYTNWVYSIAVSAVYGSPIKNNYYTPGKYKQPTATSTSAATENYVLLREAEMYLVLAEAYYKTNDLPDAIANLNVVRTRAGLANLSTTLTSDQCRAAIEQENRVEFFAEQGHRFFDLKRWPGVSGGKWRSDEVLPITKAGVPNFSWATYKNYFPIADIDLLADKNLIQNPGY